VDLKVPPPVQVIAPDVQITLPAAPPPITRTAPVVAKVAPPPPVIRAPAAPIQSVRVTYAPDPADYYPDASRRNNEEGRALVHICVDTRGRVTDANVSSSTGHPMLDDAAVKLAKAYRFKPAMQSGHAVSQCTGLPIKFELTGGG
jgi:protein TonB